MIDYDELDLIAEECKSLANLFPSLGKKYVGGEGDNPKAFIMGEALGATEEVKGRPFIGQAGQVLRDLMALADLYTEGFTADVTSTGFAADTRKMHVPPNCWLTNVVKFHPPKNRKPTEAEVRAFRPLIEREWRAVGSPSLIIPVGGIALRAVTGKPISILRAAGKCHKYLSARTGKTLYIWPMVHPSFGLRMPPVQPLLEQDWENLGIWRRANDR